MASSLTVLSLLVCSAMAEFPFLKKFGLHRIDIGNGFDGAKSGDKDGYSPHRYNNHENSSGYGKRFDKMPTGDELSAKLLIPGFGIIGRTPFGNRFPFNGPALPGAILAARPVLLVPNPKFFRHRLNRLNRNNDPWRSFNNLVRGVPPSAVIIPGYGPVGPQPTGNRFPGFGFPLYKPIGFPRPAFMLPSPHFFWPKFGRPMPLF